MSKARQALVDSYIESLEKEIIPWKQGWSTVKNYNPVTKTQYRGINRLILYNAVAKNNYNDPRWMTFSQIKAANYKLNNAKGKGVPLEKCSLYDMETKKYLNIFEIKKDYEKYFIQINNMKENYAKLDDIINKKFESQEELLSLRQRQKEITNLLTDNNNGVVLEENEAEEIELEI